MGLTGTATIVLHTHLPYCRLAGRWPHGEEWFHEAMLECYLPLLSAFQGLASELGGSLGVTMNITPILAEQMKDPVMIANARTYLADRVDRAERDCERFPAPDGRAATARFHRERYRASQAVFEAAGGDIASAFSRLEASGHIELATSAATHGYLPLLDDDDAVRFQIETGVASHIRNFGRAPRAFWLPECAYRPGLERELERSGIRVFFVETHLVTGGKARGKAADAVIGPYPAATTVSKPAELAPQCGTTFRPYSVGTSKVAVLARNERSGKQVWSASHGYPGDGRYREFHKKDDDSGLHYWRVTGAGAGLGEKALYDAPAALALAREHGAHFTGVVREELAAHEAQAGSPGIVMASYDTELFGHWWLEGVPWLREVIQRLRRDDSVALRTASEYVHQAAPLQAIDLPEGSWGEGGDHRTWLNAETAWMWPEIRQRQTAAKTLLTADTRAARQLARELLLLQASDWQFLVTTGQAKDYAIERFRGHLARFDLVAQAIMAGTEDGVLAEIERLDNPFAAIDPLGYAAAPPLGPASRSVPPVADPANLTSRVDPANLTSRVD